MGFFLWKLMCKCHTGLCKVEHCFEKIKNTWNRPGWKKKKFAHFSLHTIHLFTFVYSWLLIVLLLLQIREWRVRKWRIASGDLHSWRSSSVLFKTRQNQSVKIKWLKSSSCIDDDHKHPANSAQWDTYLATYLYFP